MTKNLDIFKDIKNRNIKRVKIYKNLFKLVDKKFPYLKKDVLEAYIKENKNTLYTLYNFKGGNGIHSSTDNNIIPNLFNNVITKLKQHYGGTDLADIVSALRSSSLPIAPSTNKLGQQPSEALQEQQGTEEEKLKILNEIVKQLLLLKDTGVLKPEELQKFTDALKTGQEINKNDINVAMIGIFDDFAENAPQWDLILEYSKDFESFKEIMNAVKKELRNKAADNKAELIVALAIGKLGALFTPAAPNMGPLQKINEREQKLAAAATADSGLIVAQPQKGGASNDSAEDASTKKEFENKMKEQNELISKIKKESSELSQIISQLLSEYSKSYSFEADDLDHADATFVKNKEDELKRILTNGELSNEERSLVSKWAAIKEEQKWVDGLSTKINKAKELYETVQKGITKLASVPNDPELEEVLRNLTLLNDGNLDANAKDTTHDKFSLPTYLSNVLNEINAAYKLIYKSYNNAGESVTKRLANPQVQNAQTSSGLSEITKQRNIAKSTLLTKIGNKIKDIDKNIGDIGGNNITNDETIINSANEIFNRLQTPSEPASDAKTALENLKKKFTEIQKNITAYPIPQKTTSESYTAPENDTYKTNIEDYIGKFDFQQFEIKYEEKTQDKSANTIENHIKEIQKKVDDTIIRQMLRTLDMKAKTQLSPEYGVLNDNPTLLDDIYNRYIKSKKTDGNLFAAINLENLLNANNLIPSEVLKITTFDKMIFAFVIILFRLIAVTIVEYMIEKEWVLSLANTIIAIGVIYTLLFVGFVMIVNFDLWRLRILFNYVNLHVNTSIILTHLAIVWGFFGIILVLIYNINFGISGLVTTIASDEDKAKLEYRIEMITALIWVVILLLVAIF